MAKQISSLHVVILGNDRCSNLFRPNDECLVYNQYKSSFLSLKMVRRQGEFSDVDSSVKSENGNGLGRAFLAMEAYYLRQISDLVWSARGASRAFITTARGAKSEAKYGKEGFHATRKWNLGKMMNRHDIDEFITLFKYFARSLHSP